MSKLWENYCIMCKAEYISMKGDPYGIYLKRAPHVWEKKKMAYFCRHSTVQNQLSWKFLSAGTYVTTLHHNTSCKLQYSWRVWTLPVLGRESSLPSEPWIIEWSLAKNHIEFQQGNELPGTSSEALVWYESHVLSTDAILLALDARLRI